jgi:hypothetical protein
MLIVENFGTISPVVQKVGFAGILLPSPFYLVDIK